MIPIVFDKINNTNGFSGAIVGSQLLTYQKKLLTSMRNEIFYQIIVLLLFNTQIKNCSSQESGELIKFISVVIRIYLTYFQILKMENELKLIFC